MTTPDDGYFLIANARAGTSERRAIDTALGILAEHAPTRVRHTDHLGELDDALEHAAGHVLVVAGGDGSLHCVVQRLWNRGVLEETAIGLVPLGTGNDLARGLGVPLDAGDAARRIVLGGRRAIDLVVDDAGGVVVNAAHAGIGAAAASRADDLKPRLGAAAYPLGALLAAVRTEGWALEVDVDGRPLDLPGDRVLMVGVGNGPSIGGGTPLCPGADPADGLLDVVVSTAVGPAARVAYANALRNGDHVRRDDVVVERAESVRIRGEAVGHNADGEIDEGVTDRTYRVHAGAWHLVG